MRQGGCGNQSEIRNLSCDGNLSRREYQMRETLQRKDLFRGSLDAALHSKGDLELTAFNLSHEGSDVSRMTSEWQGEK